MNPDEKDALWNLLGNAKQINPPPFLARNVLREIRAQQSRNTTSFARRLLALARNWKLATAACGVVVVAGALATSMQNGSPHQEIAQLAATGADYEVIANLDELLAYQETSLWTDSSPE